MNSVVIKDANISVLDLTGVVKNDYLFKENFSVLCGVVLRVRADVSSLDILDGKFLDVETNVVSGDSLLSLFVMHLNWLDFSADTC